VPIEPCRLADTREEFQVNDEDALGANETVTFAAHGTNGNCTIPTDAVGLSLNVTGLGATEPTFVSVFPGGDLPDVSSLNLVPGQPPTPNAVITSLSDTGSFDVFNLAGTVDLIIDVNGYFSSASLSELDDRVGALEVAAAAAPTETPFVIGIDLGETETIVTNGALSLEATCVFVPEDPENPDDSDLVDARLLAATAEEDDVVMDGNDSFDGDPGTVEDPDDPFLLPSTPGEEREMFSESALVGGPPDVDNDIDEGFVFSASGEYIGVDGESLVIGANYGETDCIFAGIARSFTIAP
ncbi:MAG: hypothetical protein AAFP84_17505, partial [Actinomycetota bacterium]